MDYNSANDFLQPEDFFRHEDKDTFSENVLSLAFGRGRSSKAGKPAIFEGPSTATPASQACLETCEVGQTVQHVTSAGERATEPLAPPNAVRLAMEVAGAAGAGVSSTATGQGDGVPDIALGRPTEASSAKSEQRAASLAVDGDPNTRWTSAYADEQWISVDLGKVSVLSCIMIRWEAAHAKRYILQGSVDKSTWTTLAEESGREGWVVTELPAGSSARWVRVFGQERATSFGFSIWEFRITSAKKPAGGWGLPGEAAGTLAPWTPASDPQREHLFQMRRETWEASRPKRGGKSHGCSERQGQESEQRDSPVHGMACKRRRTAKICVLFDFSSPRCWIQNRWLHRAIDMMADEPIDFQITRVPFFLRPELPGHNGPAGDAAPFGFYRDQVRGYMKKSPEKFGGPGQPPDSFFGVAWEASEVGLKLTFDQRLTSSMDAFRLWERAQRSGYAEAALERFYEAVYRGYFTEGHSLSDHAMLLNAWEVAGLPVEGVREWLLGDELRKELKRQYAEIFFGWGFTKVPVTLMSWEGLDRVVEGYQGLESYLTAFREILESPPRPPAPGNSFTLWETLSRRALQAGADFAAEAHSVFDGEIAAEMRSKLSILRGPSEAQAALPQT